MTGNSNSVRARLRALNPAPLHYERIVPETGLVIGRDPDQAGHLLSAVRISRRHCWIGCKDGRWMVRDLESTNGVYVNGKRIDGEHALEAGQVIGLGRADPADFEFVMDNRPRRVLNLSPAKRWLIGRSLQADIALPADPTVSDRHAEIIQSGDRLEIVDLDSLNGVRIDGRRVGRRRPYKLSDATVVEIGNTQLDIMKVERGGLEVVIESRSPTLLIEVVGVNAPDVGIHNFNRVFEAGQLVGILSGNTRQSRGLLELLAGRRSPEVGQILFNGRKLTVDDGAPGYRVGFIERDETMDAALTVWQHLKYTAELRLPPELDASRRNGLLETTLIELGLTQLKHAQLIKLQPLHRRLTAIAGELVTRPSLLCIDQPFADLDADQSRQFLEHLRTLTRTGTIVLVNSVAPATLQDFDQLVDMNEPAQQAGTSTELLSEPAASTDTIPQRNRPVRQAPAISWHRIVTLFRRQCRIRLTDTGMILLYLLLPTLLSLAAIALMTGTQDIRLVLCLVAMAAAVLTAAPEVGADRIRLRHEVHAGLTPTEDLLARLAFCWLVGLVQVPIIAGLLAFEAGSELAHWPGIVVVLIAVAWTGSALGLVIGAIDPTRARLVLPIAAAVITMQWLVIAMPAPEQELTGWLFRRVRDVLPAYWGMTLLTLLENDLTEHVRAAIRSAAFLIGQILTWLIIAHSLIRRQVRTR